jgi:excinuclease ABC subunit A
VEEALGALGNIPQIAAKLKTLNDVGLGYIHLGQSSTTLSGGEAQRIKLARELSKRQTGKTLYLLDEPTTGLHFDDVKKLLDVLHRLTDLGNTIIIIEHNMDVIRNADWIIDLGPEGGEHGGRVVAMGPVNTIVRQKKSFTGQALAEYMKRG